MSLEELSDNDQDGEENYHTVSLGELSGNEQDGEESYHTVSLKELSDEESSDEELSGEEKYCLQKKV
ncbi:MAG: hypothetical protein QS748_09540 [Candidatus Endonucleobacter bathymodioli]|uniref:Uncharacterized protein n=1 Tax=Candidatus Endonucleibacter bathymodioli TaxID=539814 RepID=A0AA90NMD5_9GAMM|nr:hypothetical protein [Candidatus Endonucleobacter bathymodioli]